MTRPSDDPDAPPSGTADPQTIRDWLNSPCGVPRFETATVAAYEGWDNLASGDQLEELVAAAQHAGVFGLPDHDILLWYVRGETEDLDGFLVTVDTPTGQRLCSSWLPYHTVAPLDVSGVDAAVHALTRLSASVDEALTGRHGRRPEPATATKPPVAARAFPPPPAIASTPTLPGAAPSPRGPRTGGPTR